MSDDARGRILGRVHAATEGLRGRTPLPDPAREQAVSRFGRAGDEPLADRFRENWRNASGIWVSGFPELAALLEKEAPGRGYCDPEWVESLRAAWAGADLTTGFVRNEVDGLAFGVTRAWGAIAETGTVILIDGQTPARLTALAPWVHAAVIPPGAFYRTVGEALEALPEDPSVVMITGPSKTADIEGILIEGVHGPGLQIALSVG